MFGKSVRYLDIKDIVVLVKGKIIRIESPADLDYLIREDNLADFVLLERYLFGFCSIPRCGQTNEYDGDIFISAGRAGERPFGCRRMIHMFLCVSAPHLKCLGRRSRPVRRSLSRSSGRSPTLRPSLWHRPRSSASGHFGLAVRGVSATMSNAISSDATLSSVLVFDCIDSTPRVISPNISISTTAIPNNKIFLLITIVLFFEFICPATVHPVVILVRN